MSSHYFNIHVLVSVCGGSQCEDLEKISVMRRCAGVLKSQKAMHEAQDVKFYIVITWVLGLYILILLIMNLFYLI